ncbi:hypothetical protein M0L20_28540 [Spirosoma sp. RP8]|uniref:Uncharacterized protein n=1 Tax=Spirosoma liriopis TaxID=2937440 RepID=A0ABT0HW62_9BACT|nr:hypothetical protein [Spirosoma liriopis]MCK8495848.1 hypothetical protein [Spirosoma liriopis]
MRFSQTIRLHGVAIAVTGTYEPAEAATREYPGSKAEVYPTTAMIGETDVLPLIEAADWWEPLEKAILENLGQPAYA